MKRKMKLGIIGDFNPELISHRATNDSIYHIKTFLSAAIEYSWISTESIRGDEDNLLCQDAIWCGPGSPYKDMDGALAAIRFAREKRIPYIGTCGGFQHTLIEYARNVLGITSVEHEEVSPNANRPFITKLSCSLIGRTGKVRLLPNTLASNIYEKEYVYEQFRCRYGLNMQYLSRIDDNRLKISGVGLEGEPRIIELTDHKFFMATLFLPQLSSSKLSPHPLIMRFIQVALSSLNTN